MDYHNVSCQTLMLHYSKDTLRYVKLFGALKSILRDCGVAVPGSEAGEWQWHGCPAAESQPGPPPCWKPVGCPHNPVPTALSPQRVLQWHPVLGRSPGTAELSPPPDPGLPTQPPGQTWTPVKQTEIGHSGQSPH